MEKNLRAEGVQVGKGGGTLIPTRFKLETFVALLFYFPSTPPTL